MPSRPAGVRRRATTASCSSARSGPASVRPTSRSSRPRWRAAAVREGNAEWARALLAVPVDSRLAVPDAQLAGLLPVSDRVTRAISVLAGERPGTIADIAVCPAPWPAQLTDAALGYLGA